MKKIIYSFLAVICMVMAVQNKAVAQEEQKTYNFVSMEHPPSYPDGIAKFYQMLNHNVKYPKIAMENNIQGIAKVSFIVEKDGTITNIVADTKLGFGLEEEAVRVMKLSKNWNPGIQDGKLVRVKYNIPIKFSLNSVKSKN